MTIKSARELMGKNNQVTDIVALIDDNIDRLRKKYYHKNKDKYHIEIACDFLRILREDIYDSICIGFFVIYIEPNIEIHYSFNTITVFWNHKLIKEWGWTKSQFVKKVKG